MRVFCANFVHAARSVVQLPHWGKKVIENPFFVDWIMLKSFTQCENKFFSFWTDITFHFKDVVVGSKIGIRANPIECK